MGVNDSMNIDQAGLEFISKWEGCVLHVYRDCCHLKTVGVGHLITAAEDASYPDNMPITHEFAMQLLQHDAQKCVQAIHAHITQPLNQNQFNALCCFAFNCGTGVLSNSGVARAVNEGRFADVQDALTQWAKCKINGVVQINQGLYHRRLSEAQLFNHPYEGSPEPHAEAASYMAAMQDEAARQGALYSVSACSEHPDDAEANMSVG
jgi:lysozyme